LHEIKSNKDSILAAGEGEEEEEEKVKSWN